MAACTGNCTVDVDGGQRGIMPQPMATYHSPKCSYPAQNAFVASNKPVRLHCDLYLEVKSRGYLAASDERMHSSTVWNHVRRWVAETVSSLAMNDFVFWLEVGLETLPKRTETNGKKFLKKNFISSRDEPIKRTETTQGWEDSRTPPIGAVLESLAINLFFCVWFVLGGEEPAAHFLQM